MSTEIQFDDQQDTVLAPLSRARQALAEARNASDAKAVADMVDAAIRFARRRKYAEEAIDYANTIKVDAIARMGEFLETANKNKGGGPGRGKTGSRKEPVLSGTPTLSQKNGFA